MQVLLKILVVSLVFGFGGSAFAQDQASEADQSESSAQAPETGEAPEAGSADGTEAGGDDLGVSMGTVDENRIGQTYIRETFTDWELRCVQTEDNKDPCQLYQLLRDAGGNAVAEFNLFPLPQGGQAVVGANVITPLETLLTANMRLAVDGGSAKRYPYSFCSQIGCFARIGLTAEEVGLFRRGAAATVTIVPAAAPNETVDLNLSLSGFTAGYNALLEADRALREE